MEPTCEIEVIKLIHSGTTDSLMSFANFELGNIKSKYAIALNNYEKTKCTANYKFPIYSQPMIVMLKLIAIETQDTNLFFTLIWQWQLKR